jgi:AbrB family looped-hinge helix DNA binding protein
MKQVLSNQPQGEYLRILGKGMVTIPKAWREELGLQEGGIVKAQKIGNKLIIEGEADEVPYRIFSNEEIEEWLKGDKIPVYLARKTEKKIKVYSMGGLKDDLRRVQIYDNI